MTVLLSRSIFWITWFGFILIGLSVLGVAGLQEQISRLFQFLPEVFVGILILFLGAMTANFLSRTALLAAVNAGHPSARILSWSIRFRYLDSGDLDDAGGARRGKANRDLGLFDYFWSLDAWAGDRFRVRRPRSGSEVSGEIFREHQKRKG